ncbi:ISAzo13-like element transposase-related protein [Prevotellamassilia timonensis]|uniref:ISAzo13-like element transposase-related protein n=1 Tax=Prevotellamassilia timonensis TaxID=1852370 RepID=UPI0040254288
MLCDGSGSNACSHHVVNVVKQSLVKLASTIGVNIIMLHYPPYCSKYNPIEHYMFGPISRNWSGAPLMSIENAKN